MNGLLLQLNEFQHERETKKALEDLFERLAKYLLYRGFFRCSERYDLYITSVEFYYHEENGDIKDPIVYHRNRRKWNKKSQMVSTETKPFFEIGTLNPHMSGIDITFEKSGEYRASALIRAFKVHDKQKMVWLDEDERSTYVYEYLFDGFYVDKSLTQLDWIEIENDVPEHLPSTTRKNVCHYVHSEVEALNEGLDVDNLKVYDYDFYKTNKPCERKWRYSRIV